MGARERGERWRVGDRRKIPYYKDLGDQEPRDGNLGTKSRKASSQSPARGVPKASSPVGHRPRPEKP